MTITESKGVMELPFCSIRVNICIAARVVLMYCVVQQKATPIEVMILLSIKNVYCNIKYSMQCILSVTINERGNF